MKIYAFGNEFVEQDSLAKEIAASLMFRGHEIVFVKTPDILFDEKKAVILDVANNISSPVLIDSPEVLKTSPIFSLHDFDLANYIKLMCNLHNFKFRIIAIPQSGNKDRIFNCVLGLLDEIKDFSN